MKMQHNPLWGFFFLTTVAWAVSTQEHGIQHKCTTSDYEKLNQALQNFSKCTIKKWTKEVADVAARLQAVAEDLKHVHMEPCEKCDPSKCDIPLAPSNGGLVCVTLKTGRYCKPMCNQGYDFSFLRRSRLYEKCNADTNYTWTTQYVGGKRLAECIESSVAVSGSNSSYFPAGKDCQNITYDYEAEQDQFKTFLRELQTQEDISEVTCQCLMCGK